MLEMTTFEGYRRYGKAPLKGLMLPYPVICDSTFSRHTHCAKCELDNTHISVLYRVREHEQCLVVCSSILCYHYTMSEKNDIPLAEKLSITLPREMAKRVRGKVESGAYSSNSEVIREALRLLEDHDHLKTQRLVELREKIDQSLNTGGPSLESDAVFHRLKKRQTTRHRKP